MHAELMRTLLTVTLILSASHLACAANNNRLSPEVEAILDKADQIELISLSPERLAEKPKDAFHGWRVLGSTAIKGEDKATALTALRSAIAANEGMVAACFNPRHGIRATQGGKTVDLVICFECMQIEVFIGQERAKGVLTTGAAQPLFNKLLNTAKVPLPEKARE